MIDVCLNNKTLFTTEYDKQNPICVKAIRDLLVKSINISNENVYATCNGKLLRDDNVVSEGKIYFYVRALGGKGGFGSMLRAIGAQIEKTTNREACRDLSGRRLRDINEEKRLKNWINGQAERDQDAVDRKQKRLERMCAEPKYEFEDKNYEKERSDMTDKVANSVEEGFKSVSSSGAGCSSSLKRKHDEKIVKKKKPKLWIDADEDISSSLDSDSSSDETEATQNRTNSTETCSEDANLAHSKTSNEFVGGDADEIKTEDINRNIDSNSAIAGTDGVAVLAPEDLKEVVSV